MGERYKKGYDPVAAEQRRMRIVTHGANDAQGVLEQVIWIESNYY